MAGITDFDDDERTPVTIPADTKRSMLEREFEAAEATIRDHVRSWTKAQEIITTRNAEIRDRDAEIARLKAEIRGLEAQNALLRNQLRKKT